MSIYILQQRIGQVSLSVFIGSMSMIYVSSQATSHVAHNFDYRSYIEWETHSTNTGVTSKSEEQLIKEHALKGKDIPSLALLLRPGTAPSIKAKTKRKIILKPDIIVDKTPSVEPLDEKIKKVVLIPDINHKMKKERSFEANKKLGLQTEDNINDEDSKNKSNLAPPNPPSFVGGQFIN